MENDVRFLPPPYPPFFLRAHSTSSDFNPWGLQSKLTLEYIENADNKYEYLYIIQFKLSIWGGQIEKEATS